MEKLLFKVLSTFKRGEGESTIYLGANTVEQIEELNDTIPLLMNAGIYPKILKASDDVLEIEFIGTKETTKYIELVEKWNNLDNDSWSSLKIDNLNK